MADYEPRARATLAAQMGAPAACRATAAWRPCPPGLPRRRWPWEFRGGRGASFDVYLADCKAEASSGLVELGTADTLGSMVTQLSSLDEVGPVPPWRTPACGAARLPKRTC